MRIALVTGDHLRHRYLRKSLGVDYEIHWIQEERENFIPEPPEDCSDQIKKLFKIHFEKREKSENQFFKDDSFENFENDYKLEGKHFNQNLHKIIKNIKPDIIISYGCNKIHNDTLKIAKYYCWNIHGGLSPWYRGTITHFWPSYFLEPQFTGMTIHNTTAEIDGGGIIHQTSCDIFGGDGIHDHACRNVKYLCDNLAMILNSLINMKKVEAINQKTTGKIWTNEMWNPNHLKLVYELFDDKINQYCIDNGLLDRKPKIYSIL